MLQYNARRQFVVSLDKAFTEDMLQCSSKCTRVDPALGPKGTSVILALSE